MKPNRPNIYVAIAAIALLLVLAIQVNWLLQSAKIKEEIFNEKANMVLAKTTESLLADKAMCTQIGACADLNNLAGTATQLGKNEVHKIDSLFNHYMDFYNFHIGYSFEVITPNPFAISNTAGFANAIYNKPLEEINSKNEVALKLIFPEKKQFIIAEMSGMFIASVILIIIVLILFWRTVSSLIKEKKIAEHTTDFLNNMTHEFKTPLTNIALAGKMLVKENNLQQQEKTKHYTAIILEENEKLRQQVEQVLNMAAFERNDIVIYKSAIDFHQLIHDAVKSISVQIDNHKGQLHLALAAKSTIINGDKILLTNALCNLLDNAIKYSTSHPEITIATTDENNHLQIMVSDNGMGIEKQFQQKIFDKYYRVPTGDVHDIKGFGLGLAYTKKIITLHGGPISLTSEKGKGTTFTITLPHA